MSQGRLVNPYFTSHNQLLNENRNFPPMRYILNYILSLEKSYP